jgi:hypothetical protein
MQKITFIILASISLFSACKETSNNELRENEKVQIDIEQMEIDIISQTLFELADFHPNQKPIVIKEFNESEKEFKKRQEKAELDFANELKINGLSFYLKDTLFVPQNYDFEFICDTCYDGLGILLMSDTLKPKYLSVSKIANKDSIIFLNERPGIDEIEVGFCGFAGYSRIIFNKEYDRAFFYFYSDCGYGICGSGHFILVEKQKGRWVIIENDEIWIS